MKATCTIDGCWHPVRARGWCWSHYEWHKRENSEEWQAGPVAWTPQHGTRKRYAKGCRCVDCKQRESEYRAEWRLRTGRTASSKVL